MRLPVEEDVMNSLLAELSKYLKGAEYNHTLSVCVMCTALSMQLEFLVKKRKPRKAKKPSVH